MKKILTSDDEQKLREDLVDEETYKALEEIVAKKLNDVLVGENSIVDENGNANIPIANEPSKYGLTKYHSKFGINVREDGFVSVLASGDVSINNRDTNPYPITPSKLDYAVKQALCDGKGEAYTYDEQQQAQERLGLGWKLLGDVTVEEDDVTSIEIPIDRTKNYNEFQFYIKVAERKTPTSANIFVGFDGVTSTSYCLTYVGVGTNSTYVLRGYVMRNCNNGWLSYALGSNNGMPCNNNQGKGVPYYKAGVLTDTSNPRNIRVSLQTGLDIGSQVIVYAR